MLCSGQGGPTCEGYGEIFQACVKAYRRRGNSEICCELGHFYEDIQDYEEAAVWYYNAVYETQPILTSHSAKEEPLAGLVRCYCELGEEEQAESYRKELEQL